MSTPPTAPPRPPQEQRIIDPRFRQRLVEVRRLEGRRRLRVVVVLAGFLLFALVAWGLTRSPLLNVDHVRVTGTARTTPAEIMAAAGVHDGMAMIDVDGGDAAARLHTVPWILRAHVERHWPSTVTISVVERVPVAAAPAKAGFATVDATGRVVATTGAPPPSLPMLLGLPPAGPPATRLGGRAADLLAVTRVMPPEVRARVSGIATADGGQVELKLVPTGIVRLGAPDQLAEKMVATRTVLTQVDLTRLAVLDVRVPASPAITRA
ncbi:MAG: FtsQ-type POTRA domain-containing protein [Acidimicrobiia bacterium]|nr:FtsQ-type POTRA domain-containing protein [Acidimicrobiia bacterium]